VGRSKDINFFWLVVPIRATLKRFNSASIKAQNLVQGVPGHGVPTGLIWPVSHHGLENKAALQQFRFGFGQHIHRLPTATGHVCTRHQQATVIAAAMLTRHLQQQSPRVHG
jgi:hypothetical protein